MDSRAAEAISVVVGPCGSPAFFCPARGTHMSGWNRKWKLRGSWADRARMVVARSCLLAAAFLCLSDSSVWAAAEKTKEAMRLAEGGLGAVGGVPVFPWAYPYPFPWWGWAPFPPPYPPYQPYPSYAPSPYPLYPSNPQGAPGSQSPYPVKVNPAGRLLILVNPVDAEVYVDSIRLQQRQDLSYEVGLLAGPHQVDVKSDGYKPFSQKLDIPPGGGVYLPIALEK